MAGAALSGLFRPANAATREELAWRRLSVTSELDLNGRTLIVTVGFNEGGLAREVFARSERQGSELDALLTDGCIGASVLMQKGMDAAQVAQLYSATDGYGASSALGLILARVVAVEAECGPGIRAFFAARAVRSWRAGRD